MYGVEVQPPLISTHAVQMGWTVTPAAPVYARTSFRLDFPGDVDVRAVPEALWWTLLISCLCPSWLFLQPCRVSLPVRLQAGERDAWLRWLTLQWQSLEAYRGHAADAPAIELLEGARALPSLVPLHDAGRCATAFSGGKDSLLQAGLLAELTSHPLLVAVTMPLPGLHDHTAARRREVFAQMRRRRPDAELVEVRSDFRTCWHNQAPRDAGFPVSVTETCDTHLYAAALAVMGWVRGATHLFLASEAEVQDVVDRDGRLVFHPHMMYSLPSQRLLATLLAPAGLSYGSLTWPLRSAQVQALLCRRYPDLQDLQYSCWRLGPDEAACSCCSQCLRLAMSVLACGANPEPMGIDLHRLMTFAMTWTPRPEPPPDDPPPLPDTRVGRALEAQLWQDVRATSFGALVAARGAAHPLRALKRETWAMRRPFRRLQALAALHPPGRVQGMRADLLDALDPLLREAVGARYRAAFADEPTAVDTASQACLQRAVAFLLAPLSPVLPSASPPDRVALE